MTSLFAKVSDWYEYEFDFKSYFCRTMDVIEFIGARLINLTAFWGIVLVLFALMTTAQDMKATLTVFERLLLLVIPLGFIGVMIAVRYPRHRD
jgi:hypothetical protein